MPADGNRLSPAFRLSVSSRVTRLGPQLILSESQFTGSFAGESQNAQKTNDADALQKKDCGRSLPSDGFPGQNEGL